MIYCDRAINCDGVIYHDGAIRLLNKNLVGIVLKAVRSFLAQLLALGYSAVYPESSIARGNISEIGIFDG